MSVQINPEYLATVVLLWLVVYHLVYWLIAVVRDPSLVCWSFGVLGITAVPLREPPLRLRFLQLAMATLTLAALVYTTLYVVHPGPIAGLDLTLSGRLLTVLAPVGVLTLFRLVQIVRERRFPLWGEARVMAAVQRSRATGNVIVFTRSGRTFLRERFGATPHEFLRMVRY